MASTFFSVIIPVYNRPIELAELLNCLTQQDYPNFEVVIIEDGSKTDSKEVVDAFKNKLVISYFVK